MRKFLFIVVFLLFSSCSYKLICSSSPYIIDNYGKAFSIYISKSTAIYRYHPQNYRDTLTCDLCEKCIPYWKLSASYGSGSTSIGNTKISIDNPSIVTIDSITKNGYATLVWYRSLNEGTTYLKLQTDSSLYSLKLISYNGKVTDSINSEIHKASNSQHDQSKSIRNTERTECEQYLK